MIVVVHVLSGVCGAVGAGVILHVVWWVMCSWMPEDLYALAFGSLSGDQCLPVRAVINVIWLL